MAQIPLVTQSSIFQPQTGAAPVQGFNALKNLFGGISQEAVKLSAEQIQADKLIGSQQIQTTVRGLKQSATEKFPGEYGKQQAFVNQGTQAFSEKFIANASRANRGYFTAVTKNLLSSANFSYAKNIQSELLASQKEAFNATFNQTLINNRAAIRSSNGRLTKDNIGQMVIALNNAENNAHLTQTEKESKLQLMLMSAHQDSAKMQIDAALVDGGIPAANAKLREIITDKNNNLLANSKTAVPFTAEMKSYTNAVTSGLKASQAANKDKVRNILNNALLTGKADTQEVAQFGIESEVAEKVGSNGKAAVIFTSGPVQRQKALADLDLSKQSDIDVKTAETHFETQYKKDPMGFTMAQAEKSQFGHSLENADPSKLSQIRSMGVEIQEQRRDLEIRPATNAEMDPIIHAAKSGNIKTYIDAFHGFQEAMGKFSQSAVLQLGKRLAKNGIDPSVTTIAYLADMEGKVANNVLANSTMNIKDASLAVEQRLGISSSRLTTTLNSDARDVITNTAIFSTPDSEKFFSSIRNQAGLRQGEMLGSAQKEAERYAIGTVSRGTNADLKTAMQEYFDEHAKSNHYMQTRNGAFVRIPMMFRERPVDQGKVKEALKQFQSKITKNMVDFSDVRPSVFTSKELNNERWWNSNGAYNHWKNNGTGDGYVLYAGDGLPLRWKGTNKAITLTLSDITKGTS